MALNYTRQLCIVGAGPAGLQLGHFLSKDPALGSFAIFERSSTAGSFFRRFPIHRLLISLNKRHVRGGGAEFRMRHDWNSLLGTDALDLAPMTARTTELYPHADVLAQYLEDYAQHLSENIEYNVEVMQVMAKDGSFEMELRGPRGRGLARCGRVVLASGLLPQHPQGFVGLDLLTGYEDLPGSSMFENKSALVWGFGNAAHETARELQKFTQAVTMLHRRPTATLEGPAADGLPRFAFFTHYPGDIRTVTMQIYDSYLLKALDVKLPYAAEEEPVFLRCGEKICVWVSKSSRCGGAGIDREILPLRYVTADAPRECVVEVGQLEPGHATARPLLARLRFLQSRGLAVEGRDFAWREGPDVQEALVERVLELGYGSVEEYLAARERDGRAFNGAFAARPPRLELSSAFLARQPRLLAQVARLRPQLSTDPLRHGFDVVVRCLGWRANAGHQKGAALKLTMPKAMQKYPRMDASYQSVEMPGLYFAGAVSHGRDYRRSAGGFIHGFRYTARALYRILADGWPNRSFSLAQPEERMKWMQQVLLRVNEAAGPYQMFGELVDVVLFSPNSAQYLEELPAAYAQEQFGLRPRLQLSFVYGRRFSALELPSPGAVGPEFAEFSAFLHPRLELFAPCGGPGHCPPALAHALVEDVFTEWRSVSGHVAPLFRFLQACIERVSTWLQGATP